MKLLRSSGGVGDLVFKNCTLFYPSFFKSSVFVVVSYRKYLASLLCHTAQKVLELSSNYAQSDPCPLPSPVHCLSSSETVRQSPSRGPPHTCSSLSAPGSGLHRPASYSCTRPSHFSLLSVRQNFLAQRRNEELLTFYHDSIG